MIKQLRIDFPDYSAKEQEKDAMRSRFKQIYLMKIEGKWVHYTIINNKEDYARHDEDLTKTYYELKAIYKEHTIKVIHNEGIENYLRDMLDKPKRQIDSRELKINFNEGR